MKYTALVNFKNLREVFEVEADRHYDAQIQAAREWLKRHPVTRGHDDRRRPYPIDIRPYWLVTNGYVHLKAGTDRRIRD